MENFEDLEWITIYYILLDVFRSYSYSDHVYSTAERVKGDTSTINCPECPAVIRQTTQSQPEVN